MKLQEIFAPIPSKPPDLTEAQHMERWQCQTPLVRLWRLRWYLRVPWHFIKLWLYQQSVKNPDTDNKLLWDIALGEADIRMNHTYSFDETMGALRLRQWTERTPRNGPDELPKEG